MADRFLRLLATAPVTLFVARSLGPQEFGRLGVALGIAGIALLASQLGLDRILRRDIAERPQDAGALLGTAATMSLAASIIAAFAATGYAYSAVEDIETRRLILILAWAGLPQVLAPAECWFQSAQHPRTPIALRTVVLLVCAGLRIVACLHQWPTVVFAWLALTEWLVSGAAVVLLMLKQDGAPTRFSFSTGTALRWGREAWPTFLMLVCGAAFERIDLLLLQQLSTAAEAGYYSAAQRFTELWWSLSATLAMAVVPWLTRLKKRDEGHYRQVLQQYFDASAAVTILAALVVTVTAPVLLPWLLGEDYAASVPVLILLSWAAVGVYSEIARSQYLLLERKLSLDVFFNIAHMTLTTALCWWAIPHWGATGAAVVRCVGFFCVAWVMPWMFPATRELARMQWCAFAFFVRLPPLIEMTRSLLESRRGKS